MADKRLRSGLLRERVLALLQAERRPLGALELRDRLAREHLPVAPSLVFRAIRALVDRGAVRKVMLARGYIPDPGATSCILWCTSCGATAQIDLAEVTAKLEAQAVRHRFTAARPVMEIAGTCSSCLAYMTMTGAAMPAFEIRRRLSGRPK